MKFRNIFLMLGMGVFIYVLGFSVMNFWQGYHDLDLSFNMLNQGHKADINTNGELNDLGVIYIGGLNQMRNSLIWLIFNTIFGIWLGFGLKKSNG